MDLNSALVWAEDRSDAVLITIRADGRPQSSDISYSLDAGVFAISVTHDRAKSANMRRDNRVVLHLTDRASWSYLSFDGTVEMTSPALDPNDATTNALVQYYERVAGEPHSDWAEYRAAMVAEGRVLVSFTPTSAVGQLH